MFGNSRRDPQPCLIYTHCPYMDIGLTCAKSRSSSHSSSNSVCSLFTPPQSPRRSHCVEDTVDEIQYSSAETPAIPGLYYYDSVLNDDETQNFLKKITDAQYFDVSLGRNQAVLFGSQDTTDECSSGLPQWMDHILSIIHDRLERDLDCRVMRLLFPKNKCHDRVRQCILNLYSPGQGIKAHIDIPHRFLDGIMILSFGSGVAMDFRNCVTTEKASLYLEPGSLCVLTGDARWSWSHAIAARKYDLIQSVSQSDPRQVERRHRLSVTIRWLKLQEEKDVGGA